MLLYKLKIWHKILVTSLVFLVPTVFLVYFLVHEKNIAIDFGTKEISGIAYLDSLSELYQSVCFREFDSRLRAGEQVGKEKILKAIDGIRRESERLARLGADGRLMQENRQTTVFRDAEDISSENNDEKRYMTSVASIRDLWRLVGDSSNLILDPDLDSYYLMDFCVVEMPEGIDALRRLVILSSDVAGRKTVSEEDRTQLLILCSIVRENIAEGKRSVRTAVSNDSTGGKSIENAAGRAVEESSRAVFSFLEKINDGIILKKQTSLDSGEIIGEGRAAAEKYFKAYAACSGQLRTLLEKRVSSFRFNEAVTLVLVMLLIAAAFGCSLLIMRSINRSVSNAVGLLGRMSEGDLSGRAVLHRKDELGLVLGGINSYLDTMKDMVSAIDDISEQLSKTSESLSEASSVLSSSSSEQTGEIEEITATTENISANIESIAQSSDSQVGKIGVLEGKIHALSDMITELDGKMHGALELTGRMTSDIQKRQVALRQMNESMEAISASSKEMMGIVEIISDISDQINLLSLNAAIEAARAGEQGRGFAVVAGEISKLADNTARSISDIDVLIKRNEVEIGKGMETTSSTMAMIDSLISDVSSIGSMIVSISEYTGSQKTINGEVIGESGGVRKLSSEINTAILQQRTAMRDILNATARTSEITQTNANISYLVSQASRSVLDVAGLLKEKLSFLRVK